jgi:PKD repeat protein
MSPNFTWVASNNTVTFTNTSTNVGFEEPDAYLWDFGDGTTSTLKNPVKTFAAQQSVPTNYNVKLTTRNIWEQTADITKTVTVDSIYTSGTLPVTNVRVQSLGGEGSNLMMSYLRCLRSDGANLSLNASTTSTTDPGESFLQYPGATGSQIAPITGTGLTRNILLYPNEGGLKWNGGGTTPGFFTNTTVSTTQNINSVNMRFDDTSSFQGLDFGRYYLNVNDSFGGFYPVGYWDFANTNPNPAPRQNFGRDYTMTPIRPMPPRIPYFKYTFDNRTVSFTSVETADSYAWTFGDGTTSTLKNPVKTYSARGTYTVTLAVTNGGVVTRTTTEPVIVESLLGYPIRYVKFAQKDHTGINAWDTPYLSDFRPVFNRNTVQQTTPQYSFDTSNSINIAKANTYSMEWYPGTVSPGPTDPQPIDPIVSPWNKVLCGSGGFRVKSLDGTFRTKWELVADFGTTTVNNVTQFRAQFGRFSNKDGTPNPVCAGISYEIFVTDYVGAPSGIGTATWTKIGDITPTTMPLNNTKEYVMIPV